MIYGDDYQDILADAASKRCITGPRVGMFSKVDTLSQSQLEVYIIVCVHTTRHAVHNTLSLWK